MFPIIVMTTLTLQIASDLHLEFQKTSDFNFEDILTPTGDVLALVGDIGSPTQDLFEKFIAWCAKRFEQVYFIHGNHELYTQDPNVDMTIVINIIDKICSKFSNVIYLNNHCHTYKGVRFIGTTLWSHIPTEHAALVTARLNDYRYIYKYPSIHITTDDINSIYETNRMFLEQAINQANIDGYWPVVLTHHMPWTKKTSHPRYDGSIEIVAFATNYKSSHDKIQLWVAGHTHFNCDHDLAGYRLISNQRGYPSSTIYKYNKAMSIALHPKRN